MTKDFFNRYAIAEQHIFKGSRYEIMNVCLTGGSKARDSMKSFGVKVFHLMIEMS